MRICRPLVGDSRCQEYRSGCCQNLTHVLASYFQLFVTLLVLMFSCFSWSQCWIFIVLVIWFSLFWVALIQTTTFPLLILIRNVITLGVLKNARGRTTEYQSLCFHAVAAGTVCSLALVGERSYPCLPNSWHLQGHLWEVPLLPVWKTLAPIP